ncbi:MAG: mechanosensitive ion channel [Rikenellaceae bacterium]
MPLSSLLQSTADTVSNAADSTATALDKIQGAVSQFSSMSTEELINWGITSLTSVASKILLALLIYIVGRWLIRKLVKGMKRIFLRKDTDVSLSKFIISLVNISLSIILILTTIGVLGINTSSFLAIFASAGLAVGMALSGTLQNFAGGVLILILKPFKIGDVIETQGYVGTVKEISLFSTLVNTVDNKMIIIPNGPLSNDTINNYSKESTRRVEWVIGVAYGTDYDRVKEVILEEINASEMVLQDIPPVVMLKELGDSSVNVTLRAWCKSDDYWTLFFDMNEIIYRRFNAEGIEFPFPQLDVHLRKE